MARAAIEEIARNGRLDTALAFDQQGRSELRFKICDLLAQGRLGDPQRQRRSRKAAGSGRLCSQLPIAVFFVGSL
jgi:hypothetical protein